MSKKSKARHALKRKMAKKAAKQKKRDLYKSYSESGKSSRLKKVGGKQTEPSGKKGQHAMADCGNVGCIKCYPHLNNTIRATTGRLRIAA